MNTLVDNELRVFAQIGKDIGNLRAGRQIAQAYTVLPSSACDQIMWYERQRRLLGQLSNRWR